MRWIIDGELQNRRNLALGVSYRLRSPQVSTKSYPTCSGFGNMLLHRHLPDPAYRLLFTVYFLLFTFYCLLFTVYCLLFKRPAEPTDASSPQAALRAKRQSHRHFPTAGSYAAIHCTSGCTAC